MSPHNEVIELNFPYTVMLVFPIFFYKSGHCLFSMRTKMSQILVDGRLNFMPNYVLFAFT